MTTFRVLAVLFLFSIALTPVQSAVVYVNPNSPSDGPGTDWGSAYHRISTALNSAQSGDVVWVAAGMYVENITLKDGVALYGGFAGSETSLGQRDWKTNVTILDGNKTGSVVTAAGCVSSATVVDGFTIRNGTGSTTYPYWGGGVCCRSSKLTVSNCVITANSATEGSGIAATSSSTLALTDTLFTGNICMSFGAGLRSSASAVNVSRCEFSSNKGKGAYCDSGGSVTITDSLFAQNSETAIYYSDSSSTAWIVDIERNVISGNTGDGIYCYVKSGSLAVKYNTSSTNTGSGIIAAASSTTVAGNVVSTNGDTGIGCSTGTFTVLNNTVIRNAKGIYFSNVVGTVANNISAFNDIGLYRYTSYTNTPNLYNNDVFSNTTANYQNLSPGTNDISADPLFAAITLSDLHIQPNSPCRNAGYNSASGLPSLDIDGQNRIEGTAVDIGADESYGEQYNGTGRIVYVNSRATSGGNGSTWAKAYRNIAPALDDVVKRGGAEIWIAKGTYDESITLRSYARLYGGFAGNETSRSQRDTRANETVLTFTGSISIGSIDAVVFGANYSTLDGFTVQSRYYGVYTGASPTISNNFFTGKASFNPMEYTAIYCNAGSPLITNNVITSHSNGVQCNSSSTPTIIGNRITGNAWYGIVVESSNAITISGNVITGNNTGVRCSTSTSASASSIPSIVNNTIAANSTGIYVGSQNTLPSITNNIVAFNGVGINKNAGTPTLSCNDVYGNYGTNYLNLTAGAGDVSVDPQFMNLELGDLHIKPTSPCRNAGVPASAATDIDGQARPEGTAIDIGADESYGELYSVPARIVYVEQAAPAGGDGSSWATAYQNLQTAINDTSRKGGAEIWVAEGTYTGALLMLPFSHLYGGFAGSETDRSQRDWRAHVSVIDIGRAYLDYDRVTTANVSTLDGFRVKGGSHGVDCVGTSPRLANNNIAGNQWGAVACTSYSNPTIENNYIGDDFITALECSDFSSPTIVGNEIAGHVGCGNSSNALVVNNRLGKGISLGYGSPTVVGNFICGADYGVTCGNSTAKIINNTIAWNSIAGISVDESSAVIKNNIVAFNYRGVYKSSRSFVGTPVLSRNDVYGNTTNYSGVAAGSDDVSVDPLFAYGSKFGNPHIQPTSPCRNAGVSSVPGLPALDIDGQARIQGGAVDIGADESDGTVWPNKPRVIFVNASAPDGGDGKTWTTAYKTITLAVEDARANPGAEIWVAKGFYPETFSVAMYTHLYGGFSGAETDKAQRSWKNNPVVVDGKGLSQGIQLPDVTTLDGFTLGNFSTAVNCTGNTLVTNCRLCRNDRALRSYATAPIFTNNMIAANNYGIYFYDNEYADKAVAANNTIVGNRIGLFVDSAYQTFSDIKPVVTNNIVAFNGTGLSQNGYNNDLSLANNDVYGNTTNYSGVTAGATDISADPLLAGLQAGNLHIMPTSPCKDKGTTNVIPLPLTDCDGQARIQGTSIDIGADESDGSTPTANLRVIYVDASAPVGGNGTTWSTAYRSLQDAVKEAMANWGAEIWVADGTYNGTIGMYPFTYLYGGFAGNESGKSGRNPGVNTSVIDAGGTADGNDAVIMGSWSTIDGFTVRNGCNGIRAANSSPTITNNVVTANRLAGVSLYSCSALISGNTLTGNNKGIDTLANSSAVGSTITGNTVRNNTSYGIYSYAKDVISGNIASANGTGIGCASFSCDVVNNTVVANLQKGIYCYYSASRLSNNIVAFNGVGIEQYGGSVPTLRNNNVYGNTTGYLNLSAGTTDVSADPLFAGYAGGDYHIGFGSPCINAGWNDAVGLPASDIDGSARIYNGIVDIGADEYRPLATSVGAAKSTADGARVDVGGAVVTAAFLDLFYIEDPARSSGICVAKSGHTLTVGTLVRVTGSTATNPDGERYVAADTVESAGSSQISPVGMTNRTLGGGDCGIAGQRGVKGSAGLNNIGLLVTTTGAFTYVDQSTFIITDGSGVTVTCVVPEGVTIKRNWRNVAVTGISSCRTVGGEQQRLIKIRSQQDIRVL